MGGRALVRAWSRAVARTGWRVVWSVVCLAAVGAAVGLTPVDASVRVATAALPGSPIGFLDEVSSPEAGRLVVKGWAFDVDAPGVPVAIHVYVGGPVGDPRAEGHDLGPADDHRPDVGSRYPWMGPDHGFDETFTTARVGPQMVYVYAVNVPGSPGGSVLLAAMSVAIGDPNPFGSVDEVSSPEAARVRLRGWAVDRNAVGSPVGIVAYVGGSAGSPGAERHDLGRADRSRPDVSGAFPGVGANHGFDTEVTTDRTGRQAVYVYAVNVAGTPGADVLLGVREVVVEAPDDLFTPITPTRLVDSRPGTRVGPFSTPWGAGTTRRLMVAGAASVPVDATAVVLNATATGATAGSHLTIWPAGESRPTASSINVEPGWTVANEVTVKVGAAGEVSVYNAQGSIDVVLDVVGYYREGVGARFEPRSPVRVVDSRPNGPTVGPYGTPWGAGTSRQVRIAGTNGVPADAAAVVLNATATNTTGTSYLTVWPTGAARPHASTVNWTPGWTVANAIVVGVGQGGNISVYNNAGHADVVLDVVGYFKVGGGYAFHPISPARVQDSRPGSVVGPYVTPWLGGVSRDVKVTGGRVPSYARAVAMNLTATNTTAGSHLTVWPAGATQPLASSLNWRAGWTIANAVTMPVGAGGKVGVYADAGAVDVVADVGGWYG